MASPIRWLFCEGEQGSPDVLLLRAVVNGLGVQVQPCGSKDGLPAFARGFVRRGATDDYLVFRDRDFDAEPTPRRQLLRDPLQRARVWLGHRAAVENYLLSPTLLHAWLARPDFSEADVAGLLNESARDLLAHQAARWSLAVMRPAGLSLPRLHAISGTDGELPADLSADACRAAAAARLQPVATGLRELGMNAFDEQCQRWTARFSSDSFWSGAEWLVWFHGKDLRTAVARRLSNVHWSHYLAYAATHLDWRQHPDLVQLHDLIKDRTS